VHKEISDFAELGQILLKLLLRAVRAEAAHKHRVAFAFVHLVLQLALPLLGLRFQVTLRRLTLEQQLSEFDPRVLDLRVREWVPRRLYFGGLSTQL